MSLLALVCACSVYDESLLKNRQAVSHAGGATEVAGGVASSSGTGNAGATGAIGGTGNAGSGGAGRGAGSSGGSIGSGGLGAGGDNRGGSSGSSDAGAGGDGGADGTGGTLTGTGGTITGTGGANGGKASGGTAGKTSGGATTGGATGGSASGGSAGSCRGKLSGGICWYVGARDQTCEQICSTHGSVNGAMAGVVGTSVQGGSAAKCQTLANLFGATANVISGSRDDGLGLGCHFYDPDVYWLTDPDFTEDAAEPGARIICGCNR